MLMTTRTTLAIFAAALLAASHPAILAAQTAAQPTAPSPAPAAPPAPAEPATPPAPATSPQPAAPAEPATPPEAVAPPPAAGSEEAAPSVPETAPEGEQAAPDDSGEPDLPPASFTQVDLTPDTARKAVDSLLLIQDKYKDADFGDPSDPEAFAQSMKEAGVLDQVLADLKPYGFTSVEEWARTFMSLWLAGSLILEGQEPADVDKEIAEIEADTSIPQAERDSTVAWLKITRPPEKNMEVVRELFDDPVYKQKLDEMLAIDAGEGVE
jgi:hypothetical protein